MPEFRIMARARTFNNNLMDGKKLEVLGLQIRVDTIRQDDYISLTDIAKRNSEDRPSNTVSNWLRNQATLSYLQTWEEVHNPNFKLLQMQEFRLRAVENRSLVSPKSYIEMTGAIGLVSKSGRHDGGTFAHSEIAMEFCTWLSPPFKVYFYKEFQRLKTEEMGRRSLEWHISRITDNVEEIRNLLDTIPGQRPERNRLQLLGKPGDEE